MIRVKICGVTTLDDGLAAAHAGADLLGLNFYPPSPRCLAVEQAQALAAGLRDALGANCPALVGVFVNEPPELDPAGDRGGGARRGAAFRRRAARRGGGAVRRGLQGDPPAQPR